HAIRLAIGAAGQVSTLRHAVRGGFLHRSMLAGKGFVRVRASGVIWPAGASSSPPYNCQPWQRTRLASREGNYASCFERKKDTGYLAGAFNRARTPGPGDGGDRAGRRSRGAG